ncbi:MAG TPA: ferrochelatase [Candidatus Hydrogenedentes bacterium]|nr:ferrochelatase [Candidatus Hydrogenedentota bacterium]HNT86441.1 ferrochelatase [Candidatus Hydrogenedentota bacterium]
MQDEFCSFDREDGKTTNPAKRFGVLLLNVGSPDKPDTRAVRAYLRQFLSDPRVLDIAPWKRAIILNCFILPFRPKRSAHAYRSIWTDRGSPLIAITQDVVAGLAERLPEAVVTYGMAYGRPTIGEAMDTLMESGLERIFVAPMLPQYASATTGSVLEATYRRAASEYNAPALTVIPPFYDAPEFLDAWKETARPALDEFQPEHVLFSFHGLPERHIRKGDPSGAYCLVRPDCCDTQTTANTHCYRRQCFETARGIADRLALAEEDYSISFQSRLGREPWLQPYTDETIALLAENGLKRLAVLCPAFVADCLETLEEIGIAGKKTFLDHGGHAYIQVPCLNAHPAWLDGLAAMIRRLSH